MNSIVRQPFSIPTTAEVILVNISTQTEGRLSPLKSFIWKDSFELNCLDQVLDLTWKLIVLENTELFYQISKILLQTFLLWDFYR